MATVDFGSDISTYPDLDGAFAVRTGPHIVAEAVARRYVTPRGGGLFYDLAYGFDLRQFLNDTLATTQLSQIASQCEAEAVKDERVQAASVTVTFNKITSLLTVHTVLTLALGPFTFVLTINAVTGQQVLVFGK